MNIQTIKQIEHAIGGRPKSAKPKIRLSVYLTHNEADELRALADKGSVSVSSFIRVIIKKQIKSRASK